MFYPFQTYEIIENNISLGNWMVKNVYDNDKVYFYKSTEEPDRFKYEPNNIHKLVDLNDIAITLKLIDDAKLAKLLFRF